MFRIATLLITVLLSVLAWLLFLFFTGFFIKSYLIDLNFNEGDTIGAAVASLIMSIPTAAYTLATVSLCLNTATPGRKKLIWLYALLQLIIDIALLALPVVHYSNSGPQYDPGVLFVLLIVLGILNTPLLLIFIGSLWVPEFVPPPPADNSGKFLVCPGCGYDLRGINGRSCPECGELVMSYYDKWHRRRSIWRQLLD